MIDGKGKVRLKEIKSKKSNLKKVKLKEVKPKLKLNFKKTKQTKKEIKPKKIILPNESPFIPSKKINVEYKFDSVKTKLYDVGYSKSITVTNTAAAQDELYNPTLDKESVDDLIRTTRLNKDYQTDNYINPFLQEKFEAWKMFHRIDVQIKYALDSYSAPQSLK